MKIRFQLQWLHWILFCMFTIRTEHILVAGMDIYYDGNKFFCRKNDRDIRINLSPGAELVRLQNDINYLSTRKPRDLSHLHKSNFKSSGRVPIANPWNNSSFLDSPHSLEFPEDASKDSDYGFNDSVGSHHFFSNEYKNKVDHNNPVRKPTRYDVITRLVKILSDGSPEEEINTTLQLMYEDMVTHFLNNKQNRRVLKDNKN